MNPSRRSGACQSKHGVASAFGVCQRHGQALTKDMPRMSPSWSSWLRKLELRALTATSEGPTPVRRLTFVNTDRSSKVAMGAHKPSCRWVASEGSTLARRLYLSLLGTG